MTIVIRHALHPLVAGDDSAHVLDRDDDRLRQQQRLHLIAPSANRNDEGLTNEQFVGKLVEVLEQTTARGGVRSFDAEIRQFIITSS